MTSEELKTRTKKFSLRIIDVVENYQTQYQEELLLTRLSEAVLRLELIIELYAGQEAIGSLFLKWL